MEENEYNFEDSACGRPCGANPSACPTCRDRYYAGKIRTKEDYQEMMFERTYDPDLDDE